MNKQLIRIFVTAGLLLCVWLITKHFELVLWQQLLLYLIPYLLISYDVIGEAAEGIAEGDPFDENFHGDSNGRSAGNRFPSRC